MVSLPSNTLNVLSKEYEQLKFMFTFEASLIRSRLLYSIDKRLHKIMHTPSSMFGNLNIIFFSYLCQAQLVRDYWIFEQPHVKGTNAPYNFWKENLKTYELK